MPGSAQVPRIATAAIQSSPGEGATSALQKDGLRTYSNNGWTEGLS